MTAWTSECYKYNYFLLLRKQSTDGTDTDRTVGWLEASWCRRRGKTHHTNCVLSAFNCMQATGTPPPCYT